METANEYLRKTGDEIAMSLMERELELSVQRRNSAKSRVIRLLVEMQGIVRKYDGAEAEWTDTASDEQLEQRLAELSKQVHLMLSSAEVANRLVEEDDILRLDLTKPISRTF